jgi:hypothetical protein
MSLKTWKKEFYPIPASNSTKTGSIAHSLQKWIGLLKKNLKKHEVYVDRIGYLIDSNDESDFLPIDCASCSLCWHYYAKDSSICLCYGCPLYIALGNKKCDLEENAPYTIWELTDDARPMINALRRALKQQEIPYVRSE